LGDKQLLITTSSPPDPDIWIGEFHPNGLSRKCVFCPSRKRRPPVSSPRDRRQPPSHDSPDAWLRASALIPNHFLPLLSCFCHPPAHLYHPLASLPPPPTYISPPYSHTRTTDHFQGHGLVTLFSYWFALALRQGQQEPRIGSQVTFLFCTALPDARLALFLVWPTLQS
jgi:hypothetical protein